MNPVKCFLTLLCFFATLLLSGATYSQDSKDNPREKIETAIPEAIRLLEAKEYATFLKTFVSPEDLKTFSDRDGFEEFEKHFVRSNAAPLLEMLKSIKEVKPSLEQDGKKAVFKFKEPMDGKKSVTFFKVDKFWYLQNRE